MAAEPLRRPHFSFLRAVLQGVGLRRAWTQYLAFEGGPDDERHFAARHRHLERLVRQAAEERGLAALAMAALGAPDEPPAPTPLAALPSLDEWIDERCRALGIEVDFQPQADWLADYQAEFGLEQAPTPRPATAAAGSEAPLRARLEALHQLGEALARPPDRDDGLALWLSPALARQLAQTAVGGRPLPLLRLGDLIDFANLHGHRWWAHVPRLGARRADRLMAWLAPLAAELGHPLRATTLEPQHRLQLAQARTLARLDPGSVTRLALVPLDRLAVPSALDGRQGVYRTDGPNTLGVDTDLAALQAWLRRYAHSPRTQASYARIVERFYLWALLVRRQPMSSLNEADFQAYRDFLARPPADWVQTRRAGRETDDWRPFKGPLSASSQRLNFTVIAGMLSALIEAGYLSANAARGVLPAMKLPHSRIQIDRSFSEAQWRWIQHCWAEAYAACGPRAGHGPPAGGGDQVPWRAASLRRTRLVLELGATTGLRLVELVTTRRSALTREQVDGQDVWILRVLGKGNRVREVLLFDDVKAWLDRHHADMRAASTSFDATNPRVRALRRPDAGPPAPSLAGAKPSPAGKADEGQLPLVGALRKAPPRWRLDARGVAVLDRQAPGNADRYGALDPTALYQALKRFFGRCAEQARGTLPVEDVAALRAASTHWLRHFFANAAAADKVDLVALKEAMGHASLQTTSVYVRAERSRLVGELSRLRRRGA